MSEQEARFLELGKPDPSPGPPPWVVVQKPGGPWFYATTFDASLAASKGSPFFWISREWAVRDARIRNAALLEGARNDAFHATNEFGLNETMRTSVPEVPHFAEVGGHLKRRARAMARRLDWMIKNWPFEPVILRKESEAK